jgi:hypothetical protein
MLNLGSRRGAADKAALPLMIVAFLGIAGFLYWLNVTAVGTTSAVVTAAEQNLFPDAIQISASSLENNPLQFEGAQLRIPDISVVSRVGDQAFWTQLPNDETFFVKLGPELTGDSVPVAVSSGETASVVVGVLHIMSDSVLDAWEADGAFENTATGRLEAEFADVFLELAHIEMSAPEAGESEEEAGTETPPPPGNGSQ